MMLLQIAEAYGQGLASRLSDQLFSIVLLVGFAIYSLRRQKQIEDKLDKYMQEDREEMKDVIAANTKAFETLSIKIGGRTLLLLGVVGIFLTSSCNLLRKQTHTEVLVRDSIVQIAVIGDTLISNTYRESNDTVISIPARSVKGIISAPDLTPIFTISGDTLPRSHTIADKGISVTLRILPSGAAELSGNCDSLQYIINNLIRENTSLSISRATLSEVLKTSEQNRNETVSKGTGWWGNLTTYLGAIAISFAAGFLVAYLKKSK